MTKISKFHYSHTVTKNVKRSCKQHFDYLSNYHNSYNRTNQWCSYLHLTTHITSIISIICKYHLHTIVQSVTWIDGLFLSNLIFTTQVCCGQLNAVLRKLFDLCGTRRVLINWYVEQLGGQQKNCRTARKLIKQNVKQVAFPTGTS